MAAEPLDRRDLLRELATTETRCTARSKRTGERCRLPSALGSNVCRSHGAAAPQTRAKAKRRLEQASDVLVQRLLQFALDGDVADNVALQAIRDALDRAGLGAKQAVEVSVEPAPWERLLGDVAHLTKAQHEAMKRGELLPPPPELPPAEVVDAELVPEPHEERADAPGAPSDVPPPFADTSEPLGPTPGKELVTLEEANAEVNATNRLARVVRSRRVR